MTLARSCSDMRAAAIGTLGRGLASAEPQPDRRELDEREVICGELVVARRDPTTLLDSIEEPCDLVAGTVEIRTEADRVVAIALRRDVSPCTFLHGKLSDPVGAVRTVGKHHCSRLQSRQKCSCQPIVVGFTKCQCQPYRQTICTTRA